RGPAARVLREGRAVPQAADAAGSGRGDQHARVDGVARDEREVRADAAGRAAAQVLLLERALDHVRRGRERPRHQGEDPEAGVRGGSLAAADGPGDREHPQGRGHPDRAADGGQVPRPARDPVRPDAEASLTRAGAPPEPMTEVLDRPIATPEPRLPPGARRDFAVVIPAYNEVENIPDLVRELRATFERFGLEGEVVLVDD